MCLHALGHLQNAGSQPGPNLTERPETLQGTQEMGKPLAPRVPLFLGQKWAGGGQC